MLSQYCVSNSALLRVKVGTLFPLILFLALADVWSNPTCKNLKGPPKILVIIQCLYCMGSQSENTALCEPTSYIITFLLGD